jgi:hypothetical protein
MHTWIICPSTCCCGGNEESKHKLLKPLSIAVAAAAAASTHNTVTCHHPPGATTSSSWGASNKGASMEENITQHTPLPLPFILLSGLASYTTRITVMVAMLPNAMLVFLLLAIIVLYSSFCQLH